MNVVAGLLLSLWVAVLGPRGDRAGVVAPLQVFGVASGVTVLMAGTALVVGYGAYALWGQANATVDAFGVVRPPQAVPAAAKPAPETKAATPAPAPEAPAPAEAPPEQAAPAVDETGNVTPPPAADAPAPPPAQ